MPIALIAALLPSLIGLAEKLIPKKTDAAGFPIPTGAEKKSLVTDLVLSNIDVLARHDVIPEWAAGPQADAVLSDLIEAAVAKFKAGQGQEKPE